MSLSILQVGAFPFPGPETRQIHLRATARGLAAAGHRVAIACFHSAAGRAPREVDVIRGPRLPGSRDGGWLRPVEGLLLARSLARALRRRPVDVVHVHGVEALLVARLARGARRGPPIVLDQAGDRVGLHDRLADAAIASSAGLREDLVGRGVRHVVQISPGVDPLEHAGGRRDRAIARWDLGERPWVLAVGDGDPRDLLAAIAALPDVGVLMQATADRSDLERVIPVGRLRFVDFADPEQLRDALAVAVVAGARTWAPPGFPCEILAPLAAGVPVLGPPAPWGSVGGMLAAPPAALASTLASLLADEPRRAALGREGREAISAGYTTALQAGRLGSLYADLIGR